MKKTILLADDSVTIRKVVELTFMGESFDLTSVGNGTDAISKLDDGDGPDLVIADVHMPGADGYEVCRAVKSNSPSTPVLLLVGTFETFDEQKGLEAGADDHLRKPFDSQDLLSRVHGLLARSDGDAAPATSTPDRPAFEAEAEADTEADVEPAGAGQPARTTSPVAVPSAPVVSSDASSGGSEIELSDESVDRIARRVVELLSEEAIRDVAWEVIPDLAEVVIKERLNELESQVE